MIPRQVMRAGHIDRLVSGRRVRLMADAAGRLQRDRVKGLGVYIKLPSKGNRSWAAAPM